MSKYDDSLHRHIPALLFQGQAATGRRKERERQGYPYRRICIRVRSVFYAIVDASHKETLPRHRTAPLHPQLHMRGCLSIIVALYMELTAISHRVARLGWQA
jgi:hypothetical protein